MITIHEEDHLFKLHKLSKVNQKDGIRTIEEFIEDIETSFYCDFDCSAYWACLHAGRAYKGNSVYFSYDSDDNIVWENKPDWATHVYWYSK